MRKALVVGINAYPTAPLFGCVNDAIDVSEILSKNGDGSRNFDVDLVKDVPDKSKLTDSIYKLFKGNHEITLLYFSGHGAVDDLDGYLVTPDAKKFDLGLSVTNLMKLANECESKNKIIILHTAT